MSQDFFGVAQWLWSLFFRFWRKEIIGQLFHQKFTRLWIDCVHSVLADKEALANEPFLPRFFRDVFIYALTEFAWKGSLVEAFCILLQFLAKYCSCHAMTPFLKYFKSRVIGCGNPCLNVLCGLCQIMGLFSMTWVEIDCVVTTIGVMSKWKWLKVWRKVDNRFLDVIFKP